ncbi:hypothetical protein B0H11DRAFT_1108219 [Mycena galericulata]|nr:hypothetical protein B0H11DRAFT_1108219 [Mycena galericulata]
MKRQSFTLYADAPLPFQPHQPQHQLPSASPQPHYTRRRMQSNSVNVNVNSTSIPSTPTRTRLARLLHPAPASPTRVRKHTISTHAPTEVPEGMVPPVLAALARAHARPSPIALPHLLPLQLPIILPTASDSGTRVVQLRALAQKLGALFPSGKAALDGLIPAGLELHQRLRANDDFVDPRGPPPGDNDTLTYVFIDHSNILIGLLTYLKRYPRTTHAHVSSSSASMTGAHAGTPAPHATSCSLLIHFLGYRYLRSRPSRTRASNTRVI